MLKKILSEVIGLSRLEIKVYITLLNLGPQPASVIATKTNCQRTSVYPILDRLMQKGVVTYFIKRKVKYFCPISLDKLDRKLKEEQLSLNTKAEIIEKNREDLKYYFQIFEGNNSKSQISQAEVQKFIGLESSKTMWQIVLDEKSNILSYGNILSDSNDDQVINEWKKYQQKTLHSHKKATKYIVSDEKNVSQQSFPSGSAIRIVPSSIFPLNNFQIVISGKYYGYFTNKTGVISGILINDIHMAEIQSTFFHGFWKMIHNYQNKLTNI